MKNFSVPFTIDYPNTKDFVLAKCYEKKGESYRLTIPAGAHLKTPIILKFKTAEHTLNLELEIELGKSSSATVIEDWSADVRSPAIHFENRIKCHADSDLKYIVLSHLASTADVSEKRASDVAEGAKCHVYSYFFGGKKIGSSLVQTASGKGAEISSDIIARSSADQHLSLHSEHRYTKENGSGEINMKGIVEDKAVLDFDGLVGIGGNGGGSAGYLKQEVLNLSSHTTVRAVPGLKIETNDVKAGHSSSVRNLNDEDLYYFSARGIEKGMAKKLLVTGFLGNELKKIERYEAAYETIKKLV